MIYIHEDIPSKRLDKSVIPYDMDGLFVELDFRKCKWLLLGTYHPRPSLINTILITFISHQTHSAIMKKIY